MDLQLSVDPRFPPELERSIFEIAAVLSRPKTILKLMRIAWRVKAWLEPLLYRIVAVSDSNPHGAPIFAADIIGRLIDERPGLLESSVEHLLLYNSRLAGALLSGCTRITNLFGQISATHLAAIAALPRLCRLATGSDVFRQAAVDDVHGAFRNLTHLELLSCRPGDSSHLAGDFARIPSLTHIAFNATSALGAFHTELAAHPQLDKRLQCVVLLTTGPRASNGNTGVLEDDIRLVCVHPLTMFRLEWIRGAESGWDYWAVADKTIAARRAETGVIPDFDDYVICA
ncbi:hypothetical protein DFH06DRAFT_1402547 [Mycena polygramma]|nr:hypothetical protein DFH06DRAFT_1402547 [Mycena polygramma]